MSEPSAVLSGVPHAEVSAGPLLFLIYFDAITQIPLSLGSSWTYMLIISFYIATKEHIQLDIDKVSDWVDRNHLWHSMLLRVKWWSSHAGECALPLKMSLPSQSTSQQVENYKYLVNSSLNWSTHFHNICSSASSSRVCLCYVGPAKRYINLLEGVQKFTLTVCFKQYSSSYEDLFYFHWQIYQR